MLMGCDDPVECGLSRYYDSLDREIEEEERELEEEKIKMEDLEYDLYKHKQQALIELKNAEEAIKKAYDAVGKYACAINEDETFELIDPDFLADLTLRTENLGTYSQWITEEKEEMNECRKLCETIPEVKPIAKFNEAAYLNSVIQLVKSSMGN